MVRARNKMVSKHTYSYNASDDLIIMEWSASGTALTFLPIRSATVPNRDQSRESETSRKVMRVSETCLQNDAGMPWEALCSPLERERRTCKCRAASARLYAGRRESYSQQLECLSKPCILVLTRLKESTNLEQDIREMTK